MQRRDVEAGVFHQHGTARQRKSFQCLFTDDFADVQGLDLGNVGLQPFQRKAQDGLDFPSLPCIAGNKERRLREALGLAHVDHDVSLAKGTTLRHMLSGRA